MIPIDLGRDVPVDLGAPSAIKFKEWLRERAARISVGSELFDASDENTVVDKCFEYAFVVAVNAVTHRFVLPLIIKRCAKIQHFADRRIDTGSQRQVHEFVLMAYVPVFGVVCRRVVEFGADGNALP